MTIKSLQRLPKRRVTVDELLESDAIADLLQDLYEHRHEIDQFALIYTDREGVAHNYWQGTKERIVFALENAKLQILRPVENTEED